MNYTTTRIANMALGHIGKPQIATLLEQSVEARTCAFFYDEATAIAKARSSWSFARGIQALAAVDNTYPQRWSYKYDMPSNAAKIVRLVPLVDPFQTDKTPPIPYELLGGALFTDEPDAVAEIVEANNTPAAWSADFALAVSYRLAQMIAPTLTRKSSYSNDLLQAYEMAITRAVEFDAGQQPNYYAYDAKYLIDRGGDSGSSLDGRGTDGSTYWGR